MVVPKVSHMYAFGWVYQQSLFGQTLHEIDKPEILYEVKPHYVAFPFVWFDLWKKEFDLSKASMLLTGVDYKPTLTLLASRQKKVVINGMLKLLKED